MYPRCASLPAHRRVECQTWQAAAAYMQAMLAVFAGPSCCSLPYSINRLVLHTGTPAPGAAHGNLAAAGGCLPQVCVAGSLFPVGH
jgi:hypothetical protein